MQATPKPFFQRTSTLVGGAVILSIAIIVATLNTQPQTAARIDVKSANGQAQQGLGTAGQTSEFNQTFATRLREDQALQAARMEREMKEQMEARLAAEANRIRAEGRQENLALQQRLDDLERAKQEAPERPPVSSRPFQFHSPATTSKDANTGVQPIGVTEPTTGVQALGTSGQTSRAVIPPNGFVSGRLLNGIVATIGEAPTAFLVALEGMYKAANGYTVNLNGCMATVEGRANLAAGRIDGKPAEITCNFEQDGRVQTWPVAGWIVDDTDGIRGLSANIVDNTGKKISAAAAAAALGAAGTAMNAKQFTSSTAGGVTSNSFTGSPAEAMTGAALAGAGSGMAAAINEHFSLYKPTLQKGGGARITLVLANELAVPAAGQHITRNTSATDRKIP